MKATCETLKNIRKRIAEANGIPYEPHKCTYEGPCKGTCPVCEAEANYIEKELGKLKQAKQPVNIVDVAKDMLPSPTPFKQAITAATMTAAIAFTALPIDAVAQNADTKKDEKQDSITDSNRDSTHSIRIAGAVSTLKLKGSELLYIIDGEQIQSKDIDDFFAAIKPEEIKNMEVLKSSTKNSTATCRNPSANKDVVQITLNKKGHKKLKQLLKERNGAKKKE